MGLGKLSSVVRWCLQWSKILEIHWGSSRGDSSSCWWWALHGRLWFNSLNIMIWTRNGRHGKASPTGVLLVRSDYRMRSLIAVSLMQTTYLDRLLTPSFKTTEVKDMFSDMLDIASQLVLKWERWDWRRGFCSTQQLKVWCTEWSLRFGSEYRINPVEDFTRLTLDTITLCSMSYRSVFLIYSHYLANRYLPTIQPEFLL